jgi:glycosyltransferase involved in cell wall biosynthesis
MKGISLHDKPFISSEKPKVSAVIPLYNSRYYISRALKSIKNQNLLDLEIVLVNDCSTDDTLSIVENIQKTDPRIKIVKNKKNMGIIYSRSIGALSAKGKYIFPLDNDDLFLDKDVFEEITKVADKGNFDIVEFKGVFSLIGGNNLLNNRIQDTYFSGHKLNLVMFQPELGNYPLKITNKMGEFEIIDNFLWVKCIKSKIYQKALNKLGQERYSRHMIMHEDLLVIYILFNTAQSYKFIGKYGTFHIQVAGSASWRSFRNAEMNLYNLYVVDVAIDFSQETRENKKILVYLITFMIDRPQLENTLSDDKNKKLFISCLDRILNCKLISDEDKNIIRERGKKLTFLNYPF